jgi:casein kinase II subunit alpha
VIGAAIFRSPEALLGLKWSTPTYIWSFGTTVKPPHHPLLPSYHTDTNFQFKLISLLWGKGLHLFKPPNIPADDDEFPVHVPVQQARYFGPFPLTYEEVLDEKLNRALAAVHVHIDERDLRKPFFLEEDEEVTQEDKDFICKTMRLDPRDRPSADELLADRWFGLP